MKEKGIWFLLILIGMIIFFILEVNAEVGVGGGFGIGTLTVCDDCSNVTDSNINNSFDDKDDNDGEYDNEDDDDEENSEDSNNDNSNNINGKNNTTNTALGRGGFLTTSLGGLSSPGIVKREFSREQIINFLLLLNTILLVVLLVLLLKINKIEK